MKRDKKLILTLLETLEGKLPVSPTGYVTVEFNEFGDSPEQTKYHVKLMLEAGLVAGEMYGNDFASIHQITWAGHEYLDSLRT